MGEDLGRALKKALKSYQRKIGRRRQRSNGALPYFSAFHRTERIMEASVANGARVYEKERKARPVFLRVKYPNREPVQGVVESSTPSDLEHRLVHFERRAKNAANDAVYGMILDPPRQAFVDKGLQSWDLSMDDITERARAIEREVNKHCNYSKASIWVAHQQELFVDSRGTHKTQWIPRFYINVRAGASDPKVPGDLFVLPYSKGAVGSVNAFDKLVYEMIGRAEAHGNKTERFARAPSRYPGFSLDVNAFDVVMDGEVVSVATEELFAGHHFEASRLREYKTHGAVCTRRGVRFTEQPVTISNHPRGHIDGQANFAYYAFDAEGNDAEPVVMVSDGRVNRMLATALDAGYLKGNFFRPGGVARMGRFERHWHGEKIVPYSRQAYVHMRPGAEHLMDLLSHVAGKGLYVTGYATGWADPDEATGSVHVKELYFVDKHGDLKPLRNREAEQVNIIDTAPSFHRKIEGISDRLRGAWGFCSAESGYVSHAAMSPDLFLRNVTLNWEKRAKSRTNLVRMPAQVWVDYDPA